MEVGDIVYEESGSGGIHFEYYPQVVREVEENRILVHEESINKTKWVSSFYVLEDSKYKHVDISSKLTVEEILKMGNDIKARKLNSKEIELVNKTIEDIKKLKKTYKSIRYPI